AVQMCKAKLRLSIAPSFKLPSFALLFDAMSFTPFACRMNRPGANEYSGCCDCHTWEFLKPFNE
ncbi:hypothetical protein, partial [Pseudomonas viridiflava]|uniref:hypothetical protein n=1 Tax=Pseudomonas viridiflava TaxID=33069 RepID=UPI0019826100